MPSDHGAIEPDLRRRLMSDPRAILADDELMNALLKADEPTRGGNIVDLRGVAMERLETRLGRLSETHDTLLSTAFENLSGTKQVHRAILTLFEQTSFEGFIRALGTDIADTLRVSTVRLVLETSVEDAAEELVGLGETVRVAEPGFVARYLGVPPDSAPPRCILREVAAGRSAVYGEGSGWIASEACLPVGLGPGRNPALLTLASDDARHFSPDQGTELLAFFGLVFERLMQRWLG